VACGDIRLIPDAVARPAQLEAEIRVFAIQEEALVEAAYLLECRPSHAKYCTAQPLRGCSRLVTRPDNLARPMSFREQMMDEERLREGTPEPRQTTHCRRRIAI